MNPYEYCTMQLKQSNSSLYYNILSLEKNQKNILSAIYLFSKKIEFIVSKSKTSITAYAQLSWWRYQITEIMSDNSIVIQHPIIQVLKVAINIYPKIQNIIIDFINHNEILIEKTQFYNFDELNKVYWQSDRLVHKIYQEINHIEYQYTIADIEISTAIMMTKIIRNIGKDARIGRFYIPISELKQFNIEAKDFLEPAKSNIMLELINVQIEKTYQLYKQIPTILLSSEIDPNKFYISTTAVYYELLEELSKKKQLILDQYITLSPFRKFWISWLSKKTHGRKLLRKIKLDT
ncbi:MAG: squalene/phytoene synthase family protein [Candidatus Kinetoplastibacterium crithidii]|nr:MAG: squalene/phytoene synthase family protein [Candidatus Kinetoplastibacterium crithidii]